MTELKVLGSCQDWSSVGAPKRVAQEFASQNSSTIHLETHKAHHHRAP